MSPKKNLTDKQRLFVEHYLQTWNATEAARLACYQGDDNSLAVIGCTNLRKVKIREHIEKRLREITISSDEVLSRLSQQATASVSDFIKPAGNLFVIDIDKVKSEGHLIKKIRYTKTGVEIELYDAQAALVHLGRHYLLFTDKLKVEDWRSEIVQLLKEGRLEPQDVIDEFGRDLAKELFVSAGVAIGESGEINT